MLEAIVRIVAPRVCRICGTSLNASERVLCLDCLLQLPRTGIHRDPFNEIHRRLGHHCVVDRAAGWFWYKDDTPNAQLLIDSKYAGLPAIDHILGEQCAEELLPDGFFSGIDVVTPMPMHWWKRMRRGYNQADEICRGISKVTGIAREQLLRAARSHGIQSRNTRGKRFSAIAGTLEPRPGASIAGRHVLLVDDIITSGASMQEAVRALSSASPASVSVLCLGLTARK